MSYQIRPAKAQNSKPFVCLYAESGCGKTLSALLLARGFVGPEGKIIMVETENRRGEAYADDPRVPGGYDVLSMEPPFSPKAYHEAITAAEQAKANAIIIDSGSHEWEGVGGVLDMAAQNMAAGKKSMLAWQQPKIDHQRYFMGKLLQTSADLIILCLRAKFPMQEVPKQGGGKEWVRSTKLEPKQSDDLLYESNCHAWIDHEHKLRITRADQRGLGEALGDGQMVTLETGKRLAAWSAGRAAETSNGTGAFKIIRPSGSTASAETADEWRDKMLTAIDSLKSKPDALKAFREKNGSIIADLMLDGHAAQAEAVDARFTEVLAAPPL